MFLFVGLSLSGFTPGRRKKSLKSQSSWAPQEQSNGTATKRSGHLLSRPLHGQRLRTWLQIWEQLTQPRPHFSAHGAFRRTGAAKEFAPAADAAAWCGETMVWSGLHPRQYFRTFAASGRVGASKEFALAADAAAGCGEFMVWSGLHPRQYFRTYGALGRVGAAKELAPTADAAAGCGEAMVWGGTPAKRSVLKLK
jgi:hypothetical protein